MSAHVKIASHIASYTELTVHVEVAGVSPCTGQAPVLSVVACLPLCHCCCPVAVGQLTVRLEACEQWQSPHHQRLPACSTAPSSTEHHTAMHLTLTALSNINPQAEFSLAACNGSLGSSQIWNNVKKCSQGMGIHAVNNNKEINKNNKNYKLHICIMQQKVMTVYVCVHKF